MSQNLVQSTFSALKRVRPKLSDFQSNLGLEIYRHLSKGVPVSDETLAVATSSSSSDVRAALDKISGLFRNDKDEITGFWGLAVSYRTSHKIFVEGKELNTWCAWDALFMSQLLGKTVKVESICPVSQEKVKLEVSPTQITENSHPNAVLSFLLPERFDSEIINSFCHYIHIFKDNETFENWRSDGHPECFALTLDEGYELGRLRNKLSFGKLLGGDNE